MATLPRLASPTMAVAAGVVATISEFVIVPISGIKLYISYPLFKLGVDLSQPPSAGVL